MKAFMAPENPRNCEIISRQPQQVAKAAHRAELPSQIMHLLDGFRVSRARSGR